MNFRAIALFPFGIIYGSVTWIRNQCFNFGIFKQFTPKQKTICVGNLSMGGTGKTPMIAFLNQILIEHNLKIDNSQTEKNQTGKSQIGKSQTTRNHLEKNQIEKRETAILSRGYGRNTLGFLVANNKSTSEEIGDEPLQLYQTFSESSIITVCEKRAIGLQNLEKHFPEINTVLLDDAFQHRAVKSGFSILLTTCDQPFFEDFVVPAGNLREFRNGAKRANMIIVTKCPEDLTLIEQEKFQLNLKSFQKPFFFSSLVYSDLKSKTKSYLIDFQEILLVTSIANPQPLIVQLSKKYKVTPLTYSDHHQFTATDLVTIRRKYATFAFNSCAIVCTEKDWVKIGEKHFDYLTSDLPWYCQGIEVKIDNEGEFKKIILSYVDTI